jgi:hypothetical protein
MSFSTWSQDEKNKKPLFEMEGEFQLAPWYNDPPASDPEYNIKARMRSDGWMNISKDGCLKVRARLTTGNKLNNEFFNTGIGTQEVDLSLSLRHLYMSAACLKKYTLEAGSVPVRNFGIMGLTSNGSITGFQVYIKQNERQEFILNIGNVDPDPNLFSREIKTINHFSLQTNQKIDNNKTSVFLSVSGYEDKFITRAGIAMAISKYVKWLNGIEELGLESMVIDDHYLGTMLSVKFQAMKINHRIALSQIDEDVTESEKIAFQRKQFYGYGKNILLESSKQLNHELTVNARFRFGDAGPLVQFGILKKISTTKK